MRRAILVWDVCILTNGSLEMNNGVVVLEHVDFLNIGKGLDTYSRKIPT